MQMKWVRYVVVLWVFGCQNEPIQQNPYLNNLPAFEFEINLDLPLYDALRFPGGSITLDPLGLQGVHLYNLNGSQILAWEASCPNQKPSDCSKTTRNNTVAVCRCDQSTYSLVTGQPLTEGVEYGLVNYGIRRSGNVVLVYN